jgi:hypothetical protein
MCVQRVDEGGEVCACRGWMKVERYVRAEGG